MLTLKSLDSSIISLIILFIVYMNVHNRSQKIFTSNSLFIALVRMNMIMLVIDLCKWLLNGLPGSFSMISHMTLNFLYYLLAPGAPILWLLYTNYQVYHDVKRLKKLKNLLYIPFVINGIASATSLYTGWLYLVDANNIYHRGKYLWVYVTFCFFMLGTSLFYILNNRKNLEKRYYYALITFFLPAVIGITVQLFIYGSNYTWSGTMLSLLIVYFYIQDRSLRTDYLTGVFNRRQLDRYIKQKIQNSTEKKSFSAILIDLNKFKQINDNFGHAIGDEALRESVKIIRKCLRKDDFLARFGGDEFYVILDISDKEKLEEVVNRIRSGVENFNRENNKPYNLGFGMGYDFYDYKSKMKADEFFRHLDMLMYNNKNSVSS